jgi:hypothetical protein
MLAAIALLLAGGAIVLEIVHSVAHFVEATFDRVP